MPGMEMCALLRLVAELLDDVGPFHNIAAQIFVELFRRHRHRYRALRGPKFDHVWPLDHRIDGCVQLVDDRLWRTARGHQSEPDRRLVAGNPGLGYRRHVRQNVRPTLAGGGERAYLAGADIWGHRGNRVDHHLHLSADDAAAGIAAAAVGNVHDVDAGHGLEQFAGHVIGRPWPDEA